MHNFFRLKEFLKYQWKAKTKYYLHSPFVYQFYQHVLEGKYPAELNALKILRKNLAASDEVIAIQDFGTRKHTSRNIADIEDNVVVRKKYGLLLYRLVNYFQPETILELGTSIGISSAYISLGSPRSQIVSIEGSANLLELAKLHHQQLAISNVEYIVGNFNESLPVALNKFEKLDLAFFDGNHTKDATLSYFHQCLTKTNDLTIFIFDDIYFSPEIKEAWEEIKRHESISLTIDVFQFGICFFRKENLAKEHFVLRY